MLGISMSINPAKAAPYHVNANSSKPQVAAHG